MTRLQRLSFLISQLMNLRLKAFLFKRFEARKECETEQYQLSLN